MKPPNETVEKPYFGAGRWSVERPLFAWTAAEQVRTGSSQRSKGMNLADIVNQSEPRTRPLYIHFP